MTLPLFELSDDFWSLIDNGFPFFNKHDIIVFLCGNSFFKYSVWSSNVFTSSRLLSSDGVGSDYLLRNHCSKTNDFNSIISVSSSRKLDLNGWLRLDVASVISASGMDCMWVLVFSGLPQKLLSDWCRLTPHR